MKELPFDPYDFFGYLASGLLVLVGMELVLGFPTVLGRDLGVVDGFILLLAAYVAGQLAATPAKALLEYGLVGALLGRPSDNLLRANPPRPLGLIFRDYFSPLPEGTRSALKTKLAREGFEGSGEDLFLFVRFAPSTRDDAALVSRLDAFRDRYGFARNLAFTSLAVAVALLVKGYAAGTKDLVGYGWTGIVVSILLVYRFLKFFRQYSYELFNAYTRAG